MALLVTPGQVRRVALRLPEAVEAPHFDMASFRVRGKIFATLPPDGTHLHVFVGETEVREAVAEDPAGVAELWWGKKLSGVRVDLRVADRALTEELIADAWRRKAPKSLQ